MPGLGHEMPSGLWFWEDGNQSEYRYDRYDRYDRELAAALKALAQPDPEPG